MSDRFPVMGIASSSSSIFGRGGGSIAEQGCGEVDIDLCTNTHNFFTPSHTLTHTRSQKRIRPNSRLAQKKKGRGGGGGVGGEKIGAVLLLPFSLLLLSLFSAALPSTV